MKDFDKRVAIITGGASGIGRASAISLAREGARIVVADMNENGAKNVADEIVANGGQAVSLRADVSSSETFETLKELTLDRFGRIDIVMNNVGGITRGLPEHLPIEEWQRIIDVNLLSYVRSNLVFVPHLIEQGEGHIVNTASFAGLYTYSFDRQPYAATKAAIVQISEGLYLYLKPKGIGVTCLCPGPVKTNILDSLRSFGPETETRVPGPMFELKEAEVVGDMVVAAIREERFMAPTDDQVRDVLVERASDWDAFLDREIERR